MFLTAHELLELTGYKRRTAQAEWLRARAWVFELSHDGSPKVLRKYAEARMGAAELAIPSRPDFTAIR